MTSDPRSPSTVDAPRATPLRALHAALGARFVDFAGYAMPVQYPAGIVQEHLHTRAQASLFDVSHMGQIVVAGPAGALEALVPSDIAALEVGQQRYTLLTNGAGGILDDLMVARLPDHYLLVVNAACKNADHAHLVQGLGDACRVRLCSDRALLALQGPAAADVLSTFAREPAALPFMGVRECRLGGIDCVVSRSGYTGEDGFEIALPAAAAESFARRLLEDARVAPAGSARAIRYASKRGCACPVPTSTTTTPAAAALGWVVARKYRDGSVPARFPARRPFSPNWHRAPCGCVSVCACVDACPCVAVCSRA